jgi:glutaredoxin
MSSSEAFTRTLYMKRGCPFCSKLAIFMAEAGITDVLWEYDTDENKAKITEKLGKVTFPTLEIAPGEFMLESGDIINKFATEKQLDPSTMLIFKFVTGEGTDDPALLKTYFKLMKYGVGKEGGFPQLLAVLDSM